MLNWYFFAFYVYVHLAIYFTILAERAQKLELVYGASLMKALSAALAGHLTVRIILNTISENAVIASGLRDVHS